MERRGGPSGLTPPSSRADRGTPCRGMGRRTGRGVRASTRTCGPAQHEDRWSEGEATSGLTPPSSRADRYGAKDGPTHWPRPCVLRHGPAGRLSMRMGGAARRAETRRSGSAISTGEAMRRNGGRRRGLYPSRPRYAVVSRDGLAHWPRPYVLRHGPAAGSAEDRWGRRPQERKRGIGSAQDLHAGEAMRRNGSWRRGLYPHPEPTAARACFDTALRAGSA